jgi:hypothetical protein
VKLLQIKFSGVLSPNFYFTLSIKYSHKYIIHTSLQLHLFFSKSGDRQFIAVVKEIGVDLDFMELANYREVISEDASVIFARRLATSSSIRTRSLTFCNEL